VETPKSGDQVKLGRRVLTVIWAAANHVIYVVDGGDLGMLSAFRSGGRCSPEVTEDGLAFGCGAVGGSLEATHFTSQSGRSTVCPAKWW